MDARGECEAGDKEAVEGADGVAPEVGKASDAGQAALPEVRWLHR